MAYTHDDIHAFDMEYFEARHVKSLDACLSLAALQPPCVYDLLLFSFLHTIISSLNKRKVFAQHERDPVAACAP